MAPYGLRLNKSIIYIYFPRRDERAYFEEDYCQLLLTPSLLLSGDLCRLLIYFGKQSVGPDLDPNCLTL